MTEDELRQKVAADKIRAKREPYLFSDKEMDDMVSWEQVAKEEPSETMKKILEHHQNYIRFWRIKNGIRR